MCLILVCWLVNHWRSCQILLWLKCIITSILHCERACAVCAVFSFWSETHYVGILRLLNSADQPIRLLDVIVIKQTNKKKEEVKNIQEFPHLKKKFRLLRTHKKVTKKRRKLFKLWFIVFKISNRLRSPILIIIISSKAKQNIDFIIISICKRLYDMSD